MTQWNPQDYARNSATQRGWASELIARLNLRGNESILDVGCGDGKITAGLAKAAPEGFVLGVDNNASFVNYAREQYPSTVCPNLRFEQMDARCLNYPQKFDLVFSNAVLHWVDDHLAFLVGSASLLKPGGRRITSCGGTGNAADMVAVLEQRIRLPQWAGYYADFTFPYFFYAPTDYARWLPQAGLQPTRVELVKKDMIHQGRADLASWIRTTWMPYTHRVPEDQREPFVLECVDAYLGQYPLDVVGQSHVRMVRLEVAANRV